jgi:hypothetical protein
LTARERGYSKPSAAAFVDWSRRFILFHGKRHPREMGLTEVGQFLESVAHTEKDPVSALAASRDALDFLYREVLRIEIGELPLPRPPRLLDQVHQVLRVRHYALSTEDCYIQWIARFILFHNKRHPRDMGADDVEQFLTDLAVNGHVSASTPNQALKVISVHVARKGVSGITSPRDALADLGTESIRAAIDGALRLLGWSRGNWASRASKGHKGRKGHRRERPRLARLKLEAENFVEKTPALFQGTRARQTRPSAWKRVSNSIWSRSSRQASTIKYCA